jgi:acetylornithine/succinyldiaminopimelate/putrescine aminotransferase/predicted amino acid dehydrogenase
MFEGNHKPRLLSLLRSIGLDVKYHRGQGDFLYYDDEKGCEAKVLDLVGGYGALLLGHSHPAIVAAAQRQLSECRPIHVQGSVRTIAGQLARELSQRARGNYTVVLANSGTEAVEAAMKHALLETGGRTFLALEGAFHGKTLGALQLTANNGDGDEFQLPGLNVVRIRINDLNHLQMSFRLASDIAGFIFEPVLGEGGVWPVERAFARRAAQLCAQHGVPMIADECQTGLGRTGEFLASQQLGIQADYIVLSKILGGGIAKISAVLIHSKRHVDTFDLKHTSTFADDDYSCAVALKTLQLIDANMLAACRLKGARFLHKLRALRNKYPDLIADVRGVGLMIGVEFQRLTRSTSFVLRLLSSQEILLSVLAGYLLKVHNIRVAPTLNAPFTLRLQPSALIENSAIDHAVSSLDEMCGRLRGNDALGLTRHLLDRDAASISEPVACAAEWHLTGHHPDPLRHPLGSQYAARVGWLFHFIHGDNLLAAEPSLESLSSKERQHYLDQMAACAYPMAMSAVDVRSRTGQVVQLVPILLPVTSRWIKRCIDTRRRQIVKCLVQNGVEAANSLGCTMLSLGQYTSIATRNGRDLVSHGIGLTTGNSYSIALAIQAIESAHMEHGLDPAQSVLAVVGATGNIGSTCAEILAPRYRRTVLVGTNSAASVGRLNKLAARIPNSECAIELGAIAMADVVMVATNSVDAPLSPSDLAASAIVCDISVPSSLHPEMAILRPDVTIIRGGICRLPHGEDLEIAGFPLAPGLTYGCMAEAILLGFEGIHDRSFTGTLLAAQIHKIENISQRHGFQLADYKRTYDHNEEPNIDT